MFKVNRLERQIILVSLGIRIPKGLNSIAKAKATYGKLNEYVSSFGLFKRLQ